MIEPCRTSGDPVRWAIVGELRGGTRRACELFEVAGDEPSLLSHHLEVLRVLGMVIGQHRGRWIDGTLSPPTLRRVADLIEERGSPASHPAVQIAYGSGRFRTETR